MTPRDWSISGLCVTTRPEDLETVEALLNRLPGTEVHASDPHRGRLVVVQERSSIEGHKRGLRDLQALPGVLAAELVLHFQDSEKQPTPNPPGGTT